LDSLVDDDGGSSEPDVERDPDLGAEVSASRPAAVLAAFVGYSLGETVAGFADLEKSIPKILRFGFEGTSTTTAADAAAAATAFEIEGSSVGVSSSP